MPANPYLLAAIPGLANLLGGILGGGDDGERRSFADSENNSPAVRRRQKLNDPRNAMFNYMTGIQKTGDALTRSVNKPVQMRSSVFQTPGQTSVPGLPFNIGSGGAVDPGIANPSLLEVEGLGLENPFQDFMSMPETDMPGQGPVRRNPDNPSQPPGGPIARDDGDEADPFYTPFRMPTLEADRQSSTGRFDADMDRLTGRRRSPSSGRGSTRRRRG